MDVSGRVWSSGRCANVDVKCSYRTCDRQLLYPTNGGVAPNAECCDARAFDDRRYRVHAKVLDVVVVNIKPAEKGVKWVKARTGKYSLSTRECCMLLCLRSRA